MKVLVLDDLFERFGGDTRPLPELIRCALGARQSVDDWAAVSPAYLFVPDAKRKTTHLFVCEWDGTILHRHELPCFELQDGRLDFQDGPTIALLEPRAPRPDDDDDSGSAE